MIATRDNEGNLLITVKFLPEEYAAFLAAPGQITRALIQLENGLPSYAETGLYFLLDILEQMIPDEHQLKAFAATLPPPDPLLSQQPCG